MKTRVNIVGFLVDIRTRNLRNMKQDVLSPNCDVRRVGKTFILKGFTCSGIKLMHPARTNNQQEKF